MNWQQIGLFLIRTNSRAQIPGLTWAEQSCSSEQGVFSLRHPQRCHAVEEIEHGPEQIHTASCLQNQNGNCSVLCDINRAIFLLPFWSSVCLDSPELTNVSVLLWIFSFDSTFLSQFCVDMLKSCRADDREEDFLFNSRSGWPASYQLKCKHES